MSLLDYQEAFLDKNPSVFLSGSQSDLAFNYTGANQAFDLSGNGRHAITGGGASIGYYPFLDSYATDLDGADDSFQPQNYPSRKNWAGNPNFERDQVNVFPAWWLLVNNSAALSSFTTEVSSDWAATGSRSVKVAGVKDGTGTYAGLGIQTNGTGGTAMPVTPGDTYYAEAVFNVTDQSAQSVAANPIPMAINFYTSGGAFISGPFSLASSLGPQKVILTGTVPATAAWAQLNIYFQTTLPNDSITFYVDNILWESGPLVVGAPVYDSVTTTTSKAQTYFDGDLPGGNWEGTPGASTSAAGPFATGSQRTFAGWARRDTSGSYDTFIGQSNSGYPNKFGFFGNNGDTNTLLMWPPTGVNTTFGIGSAPLNTWFHWALTVDSALQTAKYYLNGTQFGPTATSAAPTPGTVRPGACWFGNELDASPWDGKMAMMGIIERVLPANEILGLYNSIGGPVLA